MYLESGPVPRAGTVTPVLGEVYSSPLARLLFATTLFQVSGLLCRFRGRTGVSLEPLVDFPADQSVRATVASMQSPLGPANVAWEAIGRSITLLQCGRYDETTHEYPLALRMCE